MCNDKSLISIEREDLTINTVIGGLDICESYEALQILFEKNEDSATNEHYKNNAPFLYQLFKTLEGVNDAALGEVTDEAYEQLMRFQVRENLNDQTDLNIPEAIVLINRSKVGMEVDSEALETALNTVTKYALEFHVNEEEKMNNEIYKELQREKRKALRFEEALREIASKSQWWLSELLVKEAKLALKDVYGQIELKEG